MRTFLIRLVTWGNMASPFSQSCSAGGCPSHTGPHAPVPGVVGITLLVLLIAPAAGWSQILLKATQPGELVTLMPSDMAILESGEGRKDLPCAVIERKPELGFDLRFHSGYDVTIPLRELAGSGELLTIIFRVYPQAEPSHRAFFVQHYRVPEIAEDAKGDALLQGIVDVGEGKYHVDWMMRDRAERICSSSWDTEATLSPKDKPISLFLDPNSISETPVEPFINDSVKTTIPSVGDGLNLKLLVNFAPQNALSPELQRSDTDALVTILKAIQRDPQVARMSLVAFNMQESRVIYRQDSASVIDLAALGRALKSVRLGTVNVLQLGQKHSETDFLQDLIEREFGSASHPDAVIFAGPKAMLDADVPQDDLRRIGDIDCPVFYMNYNVSPQAVPWKDSISHAIKAFKGQEFTISRPRDLWFSTTEMLNRIVRFKRQRALAAAATGGTK